MYRGDVSIHSMVNSRSSTQGQDDPTSYRYWDNLLRKEGLGMNRGRLGGRLSYKSPKALEAISEQRQGDASS